VLIWDNIFAHIYNIPKPIAAMGRVTISAMKPKIREEAARATVFKLMLPSVDLINLLL